jgi:YbbR domain-containing protein
VTTEDLTTPPERPRDPERARTRAERARKAERARQATEAPEREAWREPPNLIRAARHTGRWIRGAFTDNYPIKFVALILAMAVFVLVQSDEDVEISVYPNIHYTVPEERVLVSEPVEQVRLTVSGSSRRIQRFDERAIERVLIDLGDRQSGEFYFTSDMFDVPEGLRVTQITPPGTALHFEPRERKDVPVEVSTVGEPAEGYLVEEMRVTPETVTVTGAKSLVAGVDAVQTRQIALDGRTVSFADTVPLVLPRSQLELAGERFVRVDVILNERVEARPLGRWPVSLEPGAGVEAEALEGWRVAPREVEVTLRGPVRLVQPIDVADISVIVEVEVAQFEGPEAREVPVEVRGLPEGVLAEVEPAEVLLEPAT